MHWGRTADSVNALSSSAANMKESNATVDSTLKELLEISSHTQQSVDQVQEQTNITNESAQAIQAGYRYHRRYCEPDQPAVIKCQY